MEEIKKILELLHSLRLTRTEHALIQQVEHRILPIVARLEAQIEAQKEAEEHDEKD